ncbi:hypothetical protein [Pseudomonas corrugata]|uniref:Uncharacterized protein n=1 Tax=Pseudomonas corrugata TaxID=47879 RepID=A0A8B6UVT9_9PSED|nr:hypothetical protein [Pseudomonas corrugata]MDU9021010.1 hypothetical protein [Pseudomonas corrugata]QTH16016.1 hypothetical protein C4C32_08990 [Pseudomonas corrugata]
MVTVISEDHFIGMLNTLLMRGYEAYQNYQANGKTFLFAKIIKVNNEAILNLVLSNCHLLPQEQQKDLIKLVSHLDVWTCQCDDLYERINPGLTDTFIFDTVVNFPKESMGRLDAYFDSKLQNKNTL